MKRVFILLIRLYRACIAPLLGQNCRFYPSCSEYSLEAFERYPCFKALWMTAKRLIRCGPWHPGGYDPVDPEKAE